MSVLSLRQEVISYLKLCREGQCFYRDLIRSLHPERYGTTQWTTAVTGLLKSGQISITGRGTKGEPKIVTLLREDSFDANAVADAVLSHAPAIKKMLTGHFALLRDLYLRGL
jgi:hypothetical protein